MKKNHRYLAGIFALLFSAVCQVSAQVPVYNVKQYGAIGDGQNLDTKAIDKAIDAANTAGGGTVYFPAGNYLSVTIHLKSNVALFIDQGAVIIAATTSE